MSNIVLLNNVNASVSHVSPNVNFDKRAQWKLIITSSGLDAEPQLFIEENYSGSKCVDPVGDWTIICNPCDTVNDSFPINDSIVTIEKKDVKLNWFRVRIDNNGNTTGNITVSLHYKTFP